MKREVPVRHANRLLNTGCVILVSSRYQSKNNIITLAWQTPLSLDPMLLGVSVGHDRYSHDMIKNSKEFVINVPHKLLLSQTHGCGRVSGAEVDKFEKYNLHPRDSQKIKTPGIKECIANIECELYRSVNAGDHTLFIGQVLFAAAEDHLFDFQQGIWKLDTELLHHLGSNLYLTPQNIYTAEER